MKISIITLFPKLHETFFSSSIIARAIEKGLLQTQIINMLDFCESKKRVDAKAVGPGAGMVIKPEVLKDSIDCAENNFGPGIRVFFTPQGKLLDQGVVQDFFDFCSKVHEKCSERQEKSCVKQEDTVGQLSESTEFSKCSREHLILICPRYEGPDQRVVQSEGDVEFSIGNYVVMGGDLPAQVFLEAFLRLLPGVVGDNASVVRDSFKDLLFDYPSFCQPKVWGGLEIPEILLSGNHEKIEEWRASTAAKNSVLKNFPWVRSHPSALIAQNKALIKKQVPKHFVCLMHCDVMVEGKEGVTSITSIDIQDIARSCKTFGVEQFFVVTPMIDQTNIATEFLDFWRSESGKKLNQTRYDAVINIELKESLEKVLESIYLQTGQSPVVLATSAKNSNREKVISFCDQEKVWEQEKPVLIILGTGHGLSPRILSLCDWLLCPIEGFCQYNHLTVRAAAGIILDRWLGINVKKNNDFFN